MKGKYYKLGFFCIVQKGIKLIAESTGNQQ